MRRRVGLLVVVACGGGGTNMPDASMNDASTASDVGVDAPPDVVVVDAGEAGDGGDASDASKNAIIQLAATTESACALLRSGDVWCWGAQDIGITGVISPTPTPTPQKVAGLSNVTQITGNSVTMCALDAAGDVFCWGMNLSGSLGHDVGSSGDVACGSYSCNPTPVQVAFPTLTKVTLVAAGFTNACAISAAGDLWCWGAAGIFATSSSLPAKVPGFSGDAVDVGVGTSMCALNQGGTVLCAGANPNGELGHVPGTAGDTRACMNCEYFNHTPIAVASLPTATAVRVTDSHACALTTNGDVYCWCADTYGQLGDGVSDVNYHGATKVLGGARSFLGLGPNNTLVNTGDAGVFAWGDNSFGQLGTGVYTGSYSCYYGAPCQAEPMLIPSLDGVTVAAFGYGTALALSPSGTVLAFGLNQYDQLGHASGSGDDICHEIFLGGDGGVTCQAKIAAMPVFP